LDRVVADADVKEILFDECADTGNVRVIRLLVEHRSAVAGETTRTALSVCGGSKKQPSAAPLSFRQCAIVAGQETVEGRVPGDHRAQESRLRAKLGLVVDEVIDVATGCFYRKGVPEELHEGRDLL
jgi:hypothetical protein